MVWCFSATTTIAIPGVWTPADGAVGLTINPQFIWGASTGAVSEHLQVSTDSIFSSCFFDQSGVADATRLVSSLAVSTRYFGGCEP